MSRTKAKAIDRFPEMKENPWYTISGCGGDIEDWKSGYQKFLDEEGAGTIKEWVKFYGKDLNAYCGLTGDTAYPALYKYLAFPTEGLDLAALNVIKKGRGDKWFSEVLEAAARRPIVFGETGLSE